MTLVAHETERDFFDSPAPRPSVAFPFLARIRYQLLGGLILAIVLPGLIRAGFNINWGRPGSLENTVFGTFLAMLCGAYVLRKLASYPGLGSTAFIIPSFAAAYIGVGAAFLFLRIDYSRFQFVVSFVVLVAWYFYVHGIERKVYRPRLLVLPFGQASRIVGNTGVDWIVAEIDQQLSLPFPENRREQKPAIVWAQNPAFAVPAGVSGVVADLHADLPSVWEEFLARCALSGVPVYHFKEIGESITGAVEVGHLSENSIGSLSPSSIYFRAKRGFDLAAVAVLSLPVGLLCLAAAIAIKLDDGGPIFFRQERMGYRGHVFTILKLRTMVCEASERHFTLKSDPRVTKVGHFLRRYRIDELPQIVNILRGEMSWIGPRPEALTLSLWYEGKIPFYRYRHIVRPGITGWAQVNQGNVAEIAAATGKLHYDFYYIKNFSPWLDLLVSTRTVGILFTGFGAR